MNIEVSQNSRAATPEIAVIPPTPTSKAINTLVIASSRSAPQYKIVSVQRLMDRNVTLLHYKTAPEKLKTEFTMLPANAMNEIPKTTDTNSLKPPEISSLFMMKMKPQIATATMLMYLPAGPVTVLTTFSRGLENSVIPPLARTISGKATTTAAKAIKNKEYFFLGILFSLSKFVFLMFPVHEDKEDSKSNYCKIRYIIEDGV